MSDSTPVASRATSKEVRKIPALYTTKVSATGGRHGSIKSEDGLLSLSLALPRELGGPGGAANPEMLFAGGYAACFENAILHVSREARHRFADTDVQVVAEIGLSKKADDTFALSASMTVTLAGVDRALAEKFVRGAHAICPYSNAIRGNIDVQITLGITSNTADEPERWVLDQAGQ